MTHTQVHVYTHTLRHMRHLLPTLSTKGWVKCLLVMNTWLWIRNIIDDCGCDHTCLLFKEAAAPGARTPVTACISINSHASLYSRDVHTHIGWLLPRWTRGISFFLGCCNVHYVLLEIVVVCKWTSVVWPHFWFGCSVYLWLCVHNA